MKRNAQLTETREQDFDDFFGPAEGTAEATAEDGAGDGAGEIDADSEAGTSGATSGDRGKGSFRTWAGKRPFTAGLLMTLAGIVVLTPAYLTFEVSNIQVQIATMSGVSTLLIGVLLFACGMMTWFQKEGRILTGLAALILGVIAIPTSNFGGFILGSLLAIIGGALALSWAPGERPARSAGART